MCNEIRHCRKKVSQLSEEIPPVAAHLTLLPTQPLSRFCSLRHTTSVGLIVPYLITGKVTIWMLLSMRAFTAKVPGLILVVQYGVSTQVHVTLVAYCSVRGPQVGGPRQASKRTRHSQMFTTVSEFRHISTHFQAPANFKMTNRLEFVLSEEDQLTS